MRLSDFSYLKKQRVLTLALAVTLSSTLFSVTAFSLLGFYRGFTAYLGEGEDIVVLYDRASRTPFTGLVPVRVSERLSSLDGVLAVSPEVIVPCILRGETVFLRGVVPESFIKLNPLTVVSGSMLKSDDIDSVIVGRNIAERLRLSSGDKVLVLGVLADRYVELWIKGVYASNSPMDDEVLAPLHVGQWLRNAGYSYVTLVRLKIDRNWVSPVRIFEEIAREAGVPSIVSTAESEQKPPSAVSGAAPRLWTRNVGVEEAQEFMKSYVERYGVTKEAILVLSIVVFFFSSASIVVATKNLVAQHREEIGVLRSVGASRRAVKADLVVKILPWSLASSAAGVTLAAVILRLVEERGYLRILSHTIPLQLDLLVVALCFVLASLVVSMSVLRSEVEP